MYILFRLFQSEWVAVGSGTVFKSGAIKVGRWFAVHGAEQAFLLKSAKISQCSWWAGVNNSETGYNSCYDNSSRDLLRSGLTLFQREELSLTAQTVRAE